MNGLTRKQRIELVLAPLVGFVAALILLALVSRGPSSSALLRAPSPAVPTVQTKNTQVRSTVLKPPPEKTPADTPTSPKPAEAPTRAPDQPQVAVPTQSSGQSQAPALSSVPRDSILWSSDDGQGDLSQWSENQGGGIYNSGTGSVTQAQNISHDGHPAIALTITDANGSEQAARIFRWDENPVQAYYSVWLYFPQTYKPANWWNVFQFKSKPDMEADANDPMWVLNVGNNAAGDMVFYLWDAINSKAYDHPLAKPAMTIPVGCWTHVEAYYRRSTKKDGQITIWQDGVKLFDVDGVKTAIAGNIQWGLANYTDQIDPSTATIYAADAMITKTWVNPENGTRCSK
jgi:hypothetical protein